MKINKIGFLHHEAYSLVEQVGSIRMEAHKNDMSVISPGCVLVEGGQRRLNPQRQVGGRLMNGGEECSWQREQHGTGPGAEDCCIFQELKIIYHNWYLGVRQEGVVEKVLGDGGARQ